MLIESKIEIGHNSMFNICQASFKSAHLLNKMALIQSQRNSTVIVAYFGMKIGYNHCLSFTKF